MTFELELEGCTLEVATYNDGADGELEILSVKTPEGRDIYPIISALGDEDQMKEKAKELFIKKMAA